jgi:serine/threonine-protein kinase
VQPEATDAASREEQRQRLQLALEEAYELRQLIGAGGFAEVYVAWDRKLKREVAVKVLRADLSPSPAFLERFRREAVTVARLRHPNIIPIYTVGESEGLVYFVMPLIQGQNLAAALAREPRLPVAEACRILTEAANALQEAHEAGLVHRDIKPENIMLEGKQRRVLVMDFGIAKALGGTGESGLTVTGMIIGTPQYMSPEQAAGRREIDHRSDQYSLAVVGYRMLTGQLPFAAETPQELVYQQIAETPKPLQELAPGIPRDLARALARAMAKDPADRFPTIEEFALAVGASKPVAPAPAIIPASAIEREAEVVEATGRPIDRRLLVAGVLGLLGFAGLYRVAYPPPISAPHDTRAEAVRRGEEFLKSAGAAGTFQKAVQFHGPDEPRVFLEQNLGLAETRRRVAEGLPLARWRLRWFQRGEVEEWKVAVDRGRVLEFQHVVAEAAPGAALTASAARALADSFLVARGWQLDQLSLVGASSATRANRTDHHFDYDQMGSAVEWRAGGAGGSGALRVSVDVQGGRVGAYRHYFRVPPEFERAAASAGAVEDGLVLALVLVGFALALGFAIARTRIGDVRWRPVIYLVVAGALAIALKQMGEWPAELYEASVQTPAAWLYWAGQFLLVVLNTAFVGGIVLVVFAAGESLGRMTLPRAMAGYQHLLTGRLWSPTVIREVTHGCLVGLIVLGATAVARAGVRQVPGVWFAEETGYTLALNNGLAFLTPVTALADAGVIAFLVLFVAAVLTRYLKATALVLAGSLVVCVLLQEARPPYFGAAETAVFVVILTLGLIHFGFLAVAVAMYLYHVAVGIAYLGAGEPWLTFAGVLALGAGLVPAGFALVATGRRARIGGAPGGP